MRHVVVNRTTLGVTVLFIVAVSAFAWWRAHLPRVGAEGLRTSSVAIGEEPTGAQLFTERCGMCHGKEDLIATRTPEEWKRDAEQILKFLADHSQATEAENRAILEFLASH